MAPSPDNRLDGRVALITGASRGIGKAIALALGREGCKVAVNYRVAVAEARSVAAQIEAAGGQAIVVAADVSDERAVARLVGDVETRLGPVLILVNNAGSAEPRSMDTLTLDEWNRCLTLNLTSAFLTAQRCLGAMRSARWGRIVNMSSAAAQSGGVVGPHYAAAKAGLLGLTRAIAQLGATHGITANAVLPALVYTDMLAARPDITPARIPVGRFGTAEEVAAAVVMLARNGYMTGQSLHVSGGTYFS